MLSCAHGIVGKVAAMSNPRHPYSETYSCPVIKSDVTVRGLNVTAHSGPMAWTMTGCSGAHKCKLFAAPAAFQSPEPTGCPYHDNL